MIIKNALPPEHHESLLAAVGQARAESIATGQNTETEMTHAAAFSPANSLQHSPPVTKLLTNERICCERYRDRMAESIAVVRGALARLQQGSDWIKE